MSTITLPARDLAERVDFCWSIRQGQNDRARFREFLPDSGVHLVFRFSPSSSSASLVGPATERATVELDEGSEYFGVRFRTAQAPRLTDVRAAELTNGYARLSSLGGRSVDSVADQLRSLPDVAARQHLIEELVRRAPPPLVEDGRCRAAALHVERTAGRVDVQELARELGLHVRALERTFRSELGIAPKRLIRLVRLRHLLGALRAGRFQTLADLAHASGYADQSHMIKDFRQLTGRGPGERDAFQTRPLATGDTRIVHRRMF
jgi:AraC-like DNA-binding protein